MKKIIVATAFITTLDLGGVQIAIGQEVPAQGQDSMRLLEEVIVTARRQSESMQDVPVAVTAFSSEALQRNQINNLQDLRGRVPSLTIGGSGQQRHSESPTIRGQGGTFGASPGVVLYYAEVPLPADFPFNGQGGPGMFFDLIDLQVLKGPQGTLFGRNTTGGALLLQPAEPESEFGASLAAQGSSYSGQDYEGVLNVPIVDETLLMRASLKSTERDGFTEDFTSGNDLDNDDFWTARLGITWTPTDKIENYLQGYYTDSSNNGTASINCEMTSGGVTTAASATIPTIT